MTVSDKTIRSYSDAQKRIREIVSAIHSEQRLVIAALANPLLALEEAGYQVTPEAGQEIEDRLRFGAKKAARLAELRAAIFERVGHPFDLSSEHELRRVLFDELKLTLPPDVPGRGYLILPPRVRWGPQTADPLESLRRSHPALEPLLEYRHIESSEPRFAPRALFQAIRDGSRSTPILSARAVLRGNQP